MQELFYENIAGLDLSFPPTADSSLGQSYLVLFLPGFNQNCPTLPSC